MIPLRGHCAFTISLAVMLLGTAMACATVYPHLAPIDDDQIRIEIYDALVDDGRIDAETISVESRDGVVILVGVVDSVDEARRALHHAGRVPGVQQVVNRLRVVPSEAQPTADGRLGSGL